MPYYRCGGGGGEHSTILAVQYANAFRGQTITCTDGTTTYTKTAPSDKNEVRFYPTTAGTWTISATISGTTYSTTATVVLNTTTIATLDTYITINVTMYGASGATITWTNADSSSGIATLTGSSASSVPIKIDPSGSTITFEDTTVSKNPSNLSANYTKNVNLSANTTEVYVMPDNAVYWWGYKGAAYQILSTANGWSSNRTFVNPTENTNSVGCNATSTASRICGIGVNAKITGDIHYIAEGITAYTGGAYYYVRKGADKNINNQTSTTVSTAALTKTDITGLSNQYSCFTTVSAGGNATLYAIWYE